MSTPVLRATSAMVVTMRSCSAAAVRTTHVTYPADEQGHTCGCERLIARGPVNGANAFKIGECAR